VAMLRVNESWRSQAARWGAGRPRSRVSRRLLGCRVEAALRGEWRRKSLEVAGEELARFEDERLALASQRERRVARPAEQWSPKSISPALAGGDPVAAHRWRLPAALRLIRHRPMRGLRICASAGEGTRTVLNELLKAALVHARRQGQGGHCGVCDGERPRQLEAR